LNTMPELPEVETIRHQLQQKIAGKTIKSVEVRYPKVVHGMSATEFARAIQNKKIKDIGRQGKLVLIRFDGNTLVVHLKMTGRLLFHNPPHPSLTLREGVKKFPPLRVRPASPAKRGEGGAGGVTKSTEVVFTFTNGTVLHYDDIRRFGYMKIVPTDEEAKFVQKEQLGIDFFDKAMIFENFRDLIRSRGGSQIKPLLMKQSLIAGIGNIYAQEACFEARVHPLRKANTLSDRELKELHNALRAIMQKAVKYHGSSVDAFVDAYGQPGKFVPHLKVYGREGEPCRRCKTQLVKKNIGGRGTVFCPKCQT